MKVKKWIIILAIIIVSFIGLVWYFGLLGILIGLPWSLLLTVLTNLDRAVDAIASFYKLGRRVNFWFERNAVEKRLETTISSSSKKINEEAGADLLPHKIDVQWREPPQNRRAFLEKGEIIVCLESSYDEERNLARASMFYVEEDLIYESQRFVNTTIMKSLSFAVARKLLMLDRKLGALKCLNKEFLEPEIEKMPQVREYVSGMDGLDREGLLTRVLLREFSKLDAKLSPALSDTRSRKETKSFTKLLTLFIGRAMGQKPGSLDHKGAVLQISLLPVARVESFDINNFLSVVSRCYDENTDSIYVLARGRNTVLAKYVISEVEKTGQFMKNKDWEYTITGTRTGGRLKIYVGELSRV